MTAMCRWQGLMSRISIVFRGLVRSQVETDTTLAWLLYHVEFTYIEWLLRCPG